MISGEVRVEGRPLAGVTLLVRDSRRQVFRVTTDGRGRYSINLPPGVYRVVVPGTAGSPQILLSSPQSSRQDLDFGRR